MTLNGLSTTATASNRLSHHHHENGKSASGLIVLLTTVAVTFGAVVAAQAADPDAGWYYYYFDQQRPLPLDTQRVTVLKAESLRSAKPDLTAVGISSDQVTPRAVNGWFMVDVAAGARSAPSIEQLVAQVAALPDVAFASPVFTGEDGGPVSVTRDILLGFHESVARETAESILAASAAGAIIDRDWAEMRGAYRLRSSSKNGFDVLAAANALAEHAEVKFAEPDMMFSGHGAFLPNDPGFSNCWGIHNTGSGGGLLDFDMDGPEAWDVTTGDASIIVAVLDVGVQQDHPDIHQIGGTDTTSDASTDGGPVNQFDNHGTPVAGCVSATINNGIGTVGIAPGCVSASARTFIGINSSGNWNSVSSWTVDSLTWAESIGARVSNNSNSYGFTSGAIASKYQSTRDNGMVHFASAHNDGIEFISYPASLPTVNAVSATQKNGVIWTSSNYGTGLAFSAPGAEIFTTDRTGSDGWSSGPYTYAWGTSFASPYSAGVAALALSVDPGLTAAGVEALMAVTATDLGDPGHDKFYGWGMVNAFNVVDCGGAGCIPNAPAEAPAPHNRTKNRYISVNANNPVTIALRVEMTASDFFPGSTGVLGWVGSPDANGVSRIVDTRVDRIWSESVIHVGDCPIVPAATYAVRAIGSGADETDPTKFSAPLAVSTTPQPVPGSVYWGDGVGPFDYFCTPSYQCCDPNSDCPGATCPGGEVCEQQWAPPEGAANFNDVQAAIRKFQELGVPPDTTWVDLHGAEGATEDPVFDPPNYIINFADVQQIIKGYQGEFYPYSDPAGCP